MFRPESTCLANIRAGYPKDLRDYSASADVLGDLKVRSVKLITDNPDKRKQLTSLGIKVTGLIPCEEKSSNALVRKNLKAKRDKLGHLIKHL
ncbi:MAG: hypothetical protein M1354_00825 [Candidatus Marsarchaeota archaeon]|jgi:3,4-dihydroxy 2-butanone 4-phosphate synthase/GTP cyclohydrolase II|nr:hypothetical protein [Candidatus Marsarchaeota archaeon]